MKSAASTKIGYLAILIAGLVLTAGVRLEANRQYLDGWQQYLEDDQREFADNSGRVTRFFAGLNEKLGAIGSLPAVRKLDPTAANLDSDGIEAIQQLFNGLARNLTVAKIYVTPLSDVSPRALIFNKTILRSKTLLQNDEVQFGAQLSKAALQIPSSDAENQQLQKHLKWFGVNYPSITNLKTFNSPMISGAEIVTPDEGNSIKPKSDEDSKGIVFSTPYYGINGLYAGTISAVVPTIRLRGLTAGNVEDYTLVSPLAEYVSTPVKRGNHIQLMRQAADHIPAPNIVYSHSVAIDTFDVRGKWQLHVASPAARYFTGKQFWAKRLFEYGAYAALGVLTLMGFGWHHSNSKRAAQLKENAAAMQQINDDISRLNTDLAENMAKLRDAQDEIVKKGRLAQMGQLVATVAHELRNPLSSVRTSAFLLRRKLEGKNTGVEPQLLRIDNSIARCDAVITQFLDYARTQKPDYASEFFDDWLVKVVEEEAQKLPAAVAIECELGLPGVAVSFDQNRMARVLINLINNASEAMVGKGEDATKFACPNPKIRIVTRRSERGVEFDVCDNGPGISEDNMAKIMEPLFTTKNFGTGLGLPAVSQVLQQHGGGLYVNGGAGVGATFTAWLPIAPKEAEAA